MGSINEQITRINTAKDAINEAIIASGGPGPETTEDKIDTYAARIRAIPEAVLSNLNVDPRGGIDKYIKSISQTNGVIDATLGGIVSSSESGLVPKILTATAAISNKDNEWVLSSNNGETPTWKKLPSNAFSNTNTIPSAHCSTAAGTAAKTASFTNYVATANQYFQINFTYANTYKGPLTLNINSKGAKALYINGQASSSSNYTLSGGPYIAFYDGTNYYINTDGTIPRVSPIGHTHSTEDITSLQGYVKATAALLLTTSDSLNTALGKLEYKADTVYTWYQTVTSDDNDAIINKWGEVVKFLQGIDESELILTKFVTIDGELNISGLKTFTNHTIFTKNIRIDHSASGVGEIKYFNYRQKKYDTATGWADNILVYSDAAGNVNARLGVYGANDTLINLFLGLGNYNSPNNLKIYQNCVTFGSNSIYSTYLSLGGDSYPQLRGNGSYLVMSGGDDDTSGSVVCDSVLNAFRRASTNTSLGSSSYRWSNVFSEQGNFSGTINIRKEDSYANESDCMSNAKLIIGPYDAGAYSLLFTRNSILHINNKGKPIHPLLINPHGGDIQFGGKLLPATDNTYGIGTNTAAWKYAHINLVVGDLRGNINPIYNLNSEISTYNTVQLIKDKLVEIWSTSGNGVGANVLVPAVAILNWGTDSTSITASSQYAMIKISGAYSGSLYGQWLLSSYSNLNIGYVGRNNGEWTSIRWILNSGNLKNGVNKSTVVSNNSTTTSGRQYPIEYDKNGMLSVNVPWTIDTTSATNNTTDKLFIVGAKSQNAGIRTYSNINVYISDSSVSALNGFFETSDARLKCFMEDVKVDFDGLKSIPKKYFVWKNDDKKKIHIGTSAQEVQKLYPELVTYDEEGTLSMSYDKLSIIALKGIDDLYDMITELKEENKKLKETIQALLL